MTVPVALVNNERIHCIAELDDCNGYYKIRLVAKGRMDSSQANALLFSEKENSPPLSFNVHLFDIFKQTFTKIQSYDLKAPIAKKNNNEDGYYVGGTNDANAASSSSSSSSTGTTPSSSSPRVIWESELFLVKGINIGTLVFAVLNTELSLLLNSSFYANSFHDDDLFSLECLQRNVTVIDDSLIVGVDEKQAEFNVRAMMKKRTGSRQNWTLLKKPNLEKYK